MARWMLAARAIVSSAVLLLVVAATASGDDSVAQPPERFHLAEFRIELTRSFYTWECASYTIFLTGDGKGERWCVGRDTDTTLERFAASRESIKSLIELLFGRHFFDLNDAYDGAHWVDVSDDGRVSVQKVKIRPNPGSRTVVTVSLGSYSKTVKVGASGMPQVVAAIVSRLDDLAVSIEPAEETQDSE